ncbi:MAG TPA: hypothetical protein VF881_12430 [Polyangiaceae bacterium]
MSIHRPKRATPRRTDSSSPLRAAAPSSVLKPPKWKEAVADKPDGAFTAYSPDQTFGKDALVAHSKFGKGIVLEVDGNKVHVLFEEGIRRLMHGTPG